MPQAKFFEEFEALNPYFTMKINEYCSKTEIFWAAEGGPDPKIAEILDLGSEISYEGGGYFCKGGIFARFSTDAIRQDISYAYHQRHYNRANHNMRNLLRSDQTIELVLEHLVY